jgi:signal transduction histidine kinase
MARKSLSRKTGDTILVVDDQEEALTSVRRLLEREGHSVLTANSGVQALALLHSHTVDVMLVDYFMPRMTGEQLVRETRQFDPYVQIVLLTGYAGEKPPRAMLAELDIQGYHNKADGPDKLLLWVDVACKAQHTIQALREGERLRRELIANVSHEFRTPLNIIGGYATLIMDGTFGPLTAEAQPPLRSIADATENLTALVADFLNYSKLEARAVNVLQQPIAISELANELTRMGSLLVEGRPVEVKAELQDAPATLVSDSVKLRTILRNLVTNAAKFTTSGTITLRISASENVAIFAVQDTGPGIRPEDVAVIFEPFRQLDQGGGRGGFGLGLALARKLAAVLGGRLGVESQLGVGSTFVLQLPRRATAQQDASSTTVAESGEGLLA